MSQKTIKKWFTPNFETSPPHKKIKYESNEFKDDTKVSIQSDKRKQDKNQIKHSKNWLEKFAPKTIADLAVHPKKIKEVQDWIEHAFQQINKSKTPMLLITGPTGAGKTATVKVLCHEMKIQLSEWITPLDVEYIIENDKYNYNYKVVPKQSDIFLEFILQSSHYSSLFEDESKKIILIEDYPNAFLKDPSLFAEVLENFANSGNSPLIFICTETRGKGVNVSKNLFPQTIRELYSMTNISFNAVSNTAMKVAMKKTNVLIEQMNDIYKTLSQDNIETIINSSLGDIRNAILNLHFSSLKDSVSLQITQQKSNKKSKRKPKSGKLSNMGCDQTISILHAVGRVMNPKRVQEGSNWTFSYCPEEIAYQFLSQPGTFIAFLHENYLQHFSDIDHVVPALENLSLADCIMQEWREKDTSDLFGLSLTIRSFMHHNEKPISAWNPVKGPKFLKIEYPQLELVQNEDEINKPSGKVAVVDYLTYYKEIYKL